MARLMDLPVMPLAASACLSLPPPHPPAASPGPPGHTAHLLAATSRNRGRVSKRGSRARNGAGLRASP